MQHKKLQSAVLWLSSVFLLVFTAGKTTHSQVTAITIHPTVAAARGAVVPDAKVVAFKSWRRLT